LQAIEQHGRPDPVGERVKSCTIITCPPNALVGTLHDRMPVILTEDDSAKWLGEVPATNDELKALLVPFKDDGLTMWPINRQKLGNVRNQDREVAEPERVYARLVTRYGDIRVSFLLLARRSRIS
jgi:putative SOS response-associated peptidase YedK